jgi:hypothetical protein
MPSDKGGWGGTLILPKYRGEPDKFDGETWQGYENGLTLAYMGTGHPESISPEVKKAHLLLGLDGKARKERDMYEKWTDMPYEELLITLRNHFSKAKWRKVHQGIDSIVQKLDESCREFAGRLMAAYKADAPKAEYIPTTIKEATDVSEEDKLTKVEYEKETAIYGKVADRLLLRYFLRGLRIDIRKPVIAAKPSTMSQALGIAETHESYMESIGGMGSINMSTETTGRMLNLEVEPAVARASKQLTEINDRPHPSFRPRDPGGQDAGQTGQANFRCFACNQPGHFQRDCPGRGARETEGFECHYCGRAGHYQKDCETKRRFLEQQKRRNVWKTEHSSRQATPPPVYRRMSSMHAQGHGSDTPPLKRERGRSPTGNNSHNRSDNRGIDRGHKQRDSSPFVGNDRRYRQRGSSPITGDVGSHRPREQSPFARLRSGQGSRGQRPSARPTPQNQSVVTKPRKQVSW